MGDPLYVVDPKSQKLVCVNSVLFSDIDIKERKDLEEWVCREPKVLGEPLLIITTEFNRFDKSTRRLDLLALDEDGILVIAELKLEIEGSFADQQAIRYAAFCSGMTMSEVVRELAEHSNCSEEEASKMICEFLDTEELPELHGQPRIILAAGSIEDQELTSCVLWLRQFGVDITCVELTPYKIEGFSNIILLPKILIPQPETKSFQVGIEKKQVQRILNDKTLSANKDLWIAIAEHFNKLRLPLSTNSIAKKSIYMTVQFGNPNIHYEWIIRKSEQRLDVSLDFESSDRNQNLAWLEKVKMREQTIKEGIDYEFQANPRRKKWAQLMFRIPYIGEQPSLELAPIAANLMKVLIDRTFDLVKTF